MEYDEKQARNKKRCVGNKDMLEGIKGYGDIWGENLAPQT